MAKYRKEESLPHVLHVDTNVLWHEDKQYAVNPDFDVFWQNYSADYSIELHVPYVVRGELLFQQTASAMKALRKAKEEITVLSTVTNHPYKLSIADKTVHNRVARKLDKWISGKKAIIDDIPYSDINFSVVVNNSIWRRPPFEFNANKPHIEKGFRDAMIIETIHNSCANDTRSVTKVVISNDHLFLETIKSRLSAVKQMLFFNSLDEYISHLKLLTDRMTNEFAQSILKKASEKFFTVSDSNSLVFKEQILDKLRSDYSAYFDKPQKVDPYYVNIPSLGKFDSWRPLTQERWFISPTQYDTSDGNLLYTWKTTVQFACLYRRESSFGKFEMFAVKDDMLLLLNFVVTWSSKVKSDGRFFDLEIANIELGEKSFSYPTDEQLRYYNYKNDET